MGLEVQGAAPAAPAESHAPVHVDRCRGRGKKVGQRFSSERWEEIGSSSGEAAVCRKSCTGDCKINARFFFPCTGIGGGGAGRRLSAEGFPPRPPDLNVERREGLVRPAQKRAFILQRSRPLLEATLRSGVRGARVVAGNARTRRHDTDGRVVADTPTRAFILQSPVENEFIL